MTSTNKCPRCDADSVELGKIQLPVGTTRKASVSIRLCGKCALIFYEAIEKIPTTL
jgi:predicted nucleic-acid-binding Zn-ribbon protein